MFNNFFSENRVLYGLTWTNTIQPDRPQMTIRRMRIACWITKATDTLRICNTYCFYTATMVGYANVPQCLRYSTMHVMLNSALYIAHAGGKEEIC
jgi:uncharacterized protein YciW